MAVTQKTFVLNDFGKSQVKRIERQTRRGTKNRTVMSIKSEPVIMVIDPQALGTGPALAIRERLEEAIKGITQNAQPGTIIKRNYYARTGTSTRSGAKRYSGGRTPTKLPTGSVTLFNDSGRLAEGLAVRFTRATSEFNINVPVNRFTDDTRHLAKRLFDLVPELSRPATLLASREVRAAIEESTSLMVAKARNSEQVALVRSQLQLKNAKRKARLALQQLAKTVFG